MPLMCGRSFHCLVEDVYNGNISLDDTERAQNCWRVLQESEVLVALSALTASHQYLPEHSAEHRAHGRQ